MTVDAATGQTYSHDWDLWEAATLPPDNGDVLALLVESVMNELRCSPLLNRESVFKFKKQCRKDYKELMKLGLDEGALIREAEECYEVAEWMAGKGIAVGEQRARLRGDTALEMLDGVVESISRIPIR